MIVIIDYGMGNLHSIAKAFERLNINTLISYKKYDIENAEKLVLPGVGHFGSGMKNLHELGIIDILKKKVLINKTPILGVCLGLQLFTNHSEEGFVEGLGLINAMTVKFNFSKSYMNLKVPHMGWNNARFVKENPLFNSEEKDVFFYFVHSYYIQCLEDDIVLCTTEYGFEFTSAIWKENLYGTQYHPEKSHSAGLKLLENFSRI